MQSENEIVQSSDVSTSSAGSTAPAFLRPQAPVNLGQVFTPDTGAKLDPIPDQDPSPRPGKRPRLNPVPPAAAAAMADAQREMQDQARSNLTSPTPANEVRSTLMGTSKQAVSSVSDGSNNTQAGLAAATSISEPPLAVVAENIQQTPSDTMQV